VYRIQDLIRTKRDGLELSDDAIGVLIDGVVDGSLPEYQAAALLMAIYWRGLSPRELSRWTDAMLHSGQVLDLARLSLPKVDKHSTGGVGDKVSICLAPLVAACGAAVPMISGRGLGHTGGTLDKLEAIPGFDTRLALPRAVEVVQACGLVLVGQTGDLAPADRKLYALRDLTGTIESIPLIASSIMSKKLAEGIDALVMDVKLGNGAFMKSAERAAELAQTIIEIGRRAGVAVSAVLSDMNQPLGREVGNANETREAIEVLQGDGPDDLWQLTRLLACEMLTLCGVASTAEEGDDLVSHARASGQALERLRQCVTLQGGDPRVLDDTARLPRAREERPVVAQADGVIARIETEQIGVAAMRLGAGRQRLEDAIDHGAGLTMHVRLGQQVSRGEPLATLHFNTADRAADAMKLVQQAITIADASTDPPPLVHRVLR
jgi:pyrimidine-nucleoside phosphorylase